MDPAITYLLAFITMMVDGLNRILSFFNLPSDRRKTVLYLASILLGVGLSLLFPQLAANTLSGLFGVGNSIVGQVIFGFALGLGSKAVYYLLDWVKLHRQSIKTSLIAAASRTIAPPPHE